MFLLFSPYLLTNESTVLNVIILTLAMRNAKLLLVVMWYCLSPSTCVYPVGGEFIMTIMAMKSSWPIRLRIPLRIPYT